MELDEKYCDVIINRWQNYTGKKATLELSGQTYEALHDRVKEPKVVKAKPSLDAIKARSRKKATTTAEDVLAAVTE